MNKFLELTDNQKIIIDNLNIHTIGLHDLRQKITIIPQVLIIIFSIVLS